MRNCTFQENGDVIVYLSTNVLNVDSKLTQCLYKTSAFDLPSLYVHLKNSVRGSVPMYHLRLYIVLLWLSSSRYETLKEKHIIYR
jgi:hypothetical protein